MATFNRQDLSSTGIDIFSTGTTGGTLPLVFMSLGSLFSNGGPLTYTFQRTLGESEAFGFGIGSQDDYSYDSTGLQFAVTAVPEPATWAMMLMGFGMVGFGLRRRSNVKTTVSYA